MISFIQAHYPDALSPEGLPDYNPDALWKYRRMVTRDECPHLLTPQIEKMRRAEEEKFGKFSAYIRSKNYGEFVPHEEGDAIYEHRHIELMKRAMRGEFKPVAGDVRAAGDVAGSGDKAPLMIRDGSDVVLIKQVDFANEIDLGDKWFQLLKHLEINPSQFTIDGGGIGASVAAYMETKLDYWGVNRFMANNSPHDSIAFKDRYTELHWMLRELLEFCAIRLPFCEDLLTDMRDRRFVVMDGDKIKTEPKKAHRERCGGRSPDYLDTLVYLLNDFPISEIRGMVAAKQVEAKVDSLTQMEREASGTSDDTIFACVGALPSISDILASRRNYS